MKSCSVTEATRRLDSLFDEVVAGETVILTKGQQAVLLCRESAGAIPIRPPNYFDDCYDAAEARLVNQLGASSPRGLVD